MARPRKEVKEHTPPMQIRVSLEDRERWREKAVAEGLDLSAWIRKVCDRAANRKK